MFFAVNKIICCVMVLATAVTPVWSAQPVDSDEALFTEAFAGLQDPDEALLEQALAELNDPAVPLPSQQPPPAPQALPAPQQPAAPQPTPVNPIPNQQAPHPLQNLLGALGQGQQQQQPVAPPTAEELQKAAALRARATAYTQKYGVYADPARTAAYKNKYANPDDIARLRAEIKAASQKEWNWQPVYEVGTIRALGDDGNIEEKAMTITRGDVVRSGVFLAKHCFDAGLYYALHDKIADAMVEFLCTNYPTVETWYQKTLNDIIQQGEIALEASFHDFTVLFEPLMARYTSVAFACSNLPLAVNTATCVELERFKVGAEVDFDFMRIVGDGMNNDQREANHMHMRVMLGIMHSLFFPVLALFTTPPEGSSRYKQFFKYAGAERLASFLGNMVWALRKARQANWIGGGDDRWFYERIADGVETGLQETDNKCAEILPTGLYERLHLYAQRHVWHALYLYRYINKMLMPGLHKALFDNHQEIIHQLRTIKDGDQAEVARARTKLYALVREGIPCTTAQWVLDKKISIDMYRSCMFAVYLALFGRPLFEVLFSTAEANSSDS